MLTELYVKLEYNISEGFPESAIDLVTKLLVRCLCQLTPSFLFLLLPPQTHSPHMHHLFFSVCCSSPSFPFLILITYTFPSPVLFIYLSSPSSPLPLSPPFSLLFFSLTSSYNLIGASLSEPHTSMIALLCVCLLACGHIP